MPNTFSITDGSSTVQLNDGSTIHTLDFSLPPADPRFEEIEQPSDNADITDPRLGTVSGSLRLLITGASETAIQDSIRSIERLLDTARRWKQSGTRVFFQVQLGSESDTWRTQILAARLETANIADDLPRLTVNATLAITRRFFWEGPETSLDLTTSANGTPTAEPTYFVNDDATPTQTNWVQIAASEIKGSLPSPLKLALKNTSGGSVPWRAFYINHNIFSDPSNFDPFLLGSEADSGASASWPASSTNAVLYDFGPLSDARLTDLGGRMFRIIGTFTSVSVSGGTAYLTLHVTYIVGSLHTALWSSGEIAITGASEDEVLDFGSLPIPPGGFTGSGTQIGIAIRCRSVNSGSMTMDFLQLSPTDSNREIVRFGFSDANNESLVDNGIDGTVYAENASGEQWPVWTPKGSPVHVWPNRTQRLYILARQSGGWVASTEMTARAWYRPRRSTI